MYKQELALNSLQGLICHKIQPTKKTMCLIVKNFRLYQEYHQSKSYICVNRIWH